MEHDVEQDIPNEERAEAQAVIVTPRRGRPRKANVIGVTKPESTNTADPLSHPRDVGEWKYKPWLGHDHWVNAKTGASTFNIKNVRVSR